MIAKKKVVWEVQDNYQKQTYRNRCYIGTDQGKHMLTIPIKHVGGDQGRQLYKKVRLDNSYPWQRQHWRGLQTAYRTSPFFEYFEDDLEFLFTTPFRELLDFNLKTIEVICHCLQMTMPSDKTSNYEPSNPDFIDLRSLVNAKKEISFAQNTYQQVFLDRHGFLKNLSTLDLLFNEGPMALGYLESLDLNPLYE